MDLKVITLNQDICWLGSATTLFVLWVFIKQKPNCRWSLHSVESEPYDWLSQNRSDLGWLCRCSTNIESLCQLFLWLFAAACKNQHKLLFQCVIQDEHLKGSSRRSLHPLTFQNRTGCPTYYFAKHAVGKSKYNIPMNVLFFPQASKLATLLKKVLAIIR